MRLIIDIIEDDDLAPADVLRRVLLEPGKELQIQGFRVYVVGELPEPDAGHVQFFDGEGHLGGTSLPDGRGPVMADIPAGATRLTVVPQRPPIPIPAPQPELEAAPPCQRCASTIRRS